MLTECKLMACVIFLHLSMRIPGRTTAADLTFFLVLLVNLPVSKLPFKMAAIPRHFVSYTNRCIKHQTGVGGDQGTRYKNGGEN